MRSIVRHFIYTAMAMYILQSYFAAFDFGSNQLKTSLIVAFAISLIIFFSKPALKIISFPVGGIVYTVLLVLVVGAGYYALESLIPQFSIKALYLPNWTVFGIMLGSATLEGIKALAFVSGFTAMFYSFISWVMG